MSADEPTDGSLVEVTAANMRGLAHPLRMRVLGLLRVDGPSTATALGSTLGLSSGVLSYHLRQLERYGFVVEDPTRGTGRDRWWRAAHRSTTFGSLRDDPATHGAADSFTAELADRTAERLHEAVREQHQWPTEWRDTFDLSDLVLDLTPSEARQLMTDLVAVASGYRRHDPDVHRPAGTEPYLVQLQGFLLRRSAERSGS